MHTLTANDFENAIFVVNPGAVNLFGLAYSLDNLTMAIAKHAGSSEREAEELIKSAARIVVELEILSEEIGLNFDLLFKHRKIQEVVRLLWVEVWSPNPRYSWATHPILRLYVSQMGFLTGASDMVSAPYEKWESAYRECEHEVKMKA